MGAGSGKGTKSRPAAGESDPRVRVLLFVVSQTTLDSGAPGREMGSCPRDPGYSLHLSGKGECGRGTRAGAGLGAQLRASPLREALPHLSHLPPPRSRTCILKAPCSPGIGRGRVLRAQKLEPPGGGWEPGVDCTISAASPARAPPLPHTPREAQSDGREGGTVARTRLWQGAQRAGAPSGGTSGAGRASAHPSLPRRRAPAAALRPLPARSGRGGWGSGSWAGGGPPPASPEPGERPARRPPTQLRSPLAEPRDARLPGRPGRALGERARGGARRAARVPGRPPAARGPAQRSPGAGSAGRARARAMPR